jgi:protein-tyrosine kinase
MATESAARDNLYRVLGLEPRASRAQIERAYRFHVAMYGNDTLVASTLVDPVEAERQRRRVREAYDVLSDPERRRAYDEHQGFPPPEGPAPVSGSEPFLIDPAMPPTAEHADEGPVTFAEPLPASATVREPRLSSLLASESPAFEAFRVLRTKVYALDAERPARCLGLVSATAREGTSAVAAGLAAALAQERRHVLLVEAGLRGPALEPALGLAIEPGLGEWLQRPTASPLPLRRVEPWGFQLLSGGASPGGTSERLGSVRFRRLVEAARASFDFVLVDCPPLEKAADAAVIQGALDGFLLVVRARHASRQAIRDALARLEPGALRGVVLNDRTEILARWLDRRRARPSSSAK